MKNTFFTKILFSLMIFFHVSVIEAQEELFVSEQLKIQDNFTKIANERKDYIKDQINTELLVDFRALIQDKKTFTNKFDSLKNVGVLISPDEKVKIITWNIPYSDGTHEYFGFIQYKKTKRKILTFELNDNSAKMVNPTVLELNHKNWYGALYYKIIENKYKNDVFYTLLGADLNDMLTHKKIIEVLHFNKENEPVFGKKIFRNQRSTVSRIIFEFSAQTKMLLAFDEEKQMIIYDHLAPVRPSLVGQYEFYGSDFTHDGLKFERGIWNLYQNVDVRNYNIEF